MIQIISIDFDEWWSRQLEKEKENLVQNTASDVQIYVKDLVLGWDVQVAEPIKWLC